MHCKEPIPKILNKYSQKRIFAAPIPISTFMCLWAFYIFPWSICLLCIRKNVDWSWKYIDRSQTHECGNWKWGRAIPRKGIYKRDFCGSVDGWAIPSFIKEPPDDYGWSSGHPGHLGMWQFLHFHSYLNYFLHNGQPGMRQFSTLHSYLSNYLFTEHEATFSTSFSYKLLII